MYKTAIDRFQDLRYLFLIVICVLGSAISLYSQQHRWPHKNELKKDIKFWKEIFTRYNEDQVVIHDSENLSVIYKVVTFDSSVDARNREREIKKIKKEIHDILLELAESNKSDSLSLSQRNVLHYFPAKVKPETLKRAAGNIRAQQGMRTKFQKGLERSLAYLPYIREIFRESGLPEDLAYLPHIESSFHPLARSKVGAAGMWQFMRSTGRQYMKVNRIIDQRYDPLVSTRAATKVLKYNYEKTGDWGLALTGYNYGINGIVKAMHLFNADYMSMRESFKHRRFQFASRNFYPEFLAVVEIMDDVDQYFPDVKPVALPAKLRYQFSRRVNLRKFAIRSGVDLGELMHLNPEYTHRAWRGWVHVPAGYWINLPPTVELAKVQKFLKTEELQYAGLQRTEPDQHELKKPENEEKFIIKDMPDFSQVQAVVDTIQQETAVESTEELPLEKVEEEPDISEAVFEDSLDTNRSDAYIGPLFNADLIPSMESVLQYFQPEVVEKEVESTPEMGVQAPGLPESQSDSPLLEQMTDELQQVLAVKSGNILVFANETLGHYADWLHVSVRYLMKINHLRNRTIYQGQRLKLNFGQVSVKEFQNQRNAYHLNSLEKVLRKNPFHNVVEYKVRSGESVWDLAQNRYGISLEIIQYFNSTRDINKLYPGDVIRIPVFLTNKSMEEAL